MGGTCDSSSVSIGGLAEAFAEEFELFAFLPAFCFEALSDAPVLA